MHPFSANDYRKRVLAAVERRGGVGESDAFELYDIPLDEALALESGALTDAEVAVRLDEVWAVWQKHRDHPKYRVLVGQLVREHDQRSAELRFSGPRVALARRVGDARRQRDEGRYELLDTAIDRLVQRYGGIPAAKRKGLDDIGAMGGLTPAEIAARLRRYRVIDDTSAPPAAPSSGLSTGRSVQIETLLGEFDRLQGDRSTPTLLAVLRLTLDDATDLTEITLRTEQLTGRSRELPAGRLRAVVDELIVHIRELLLDDVTLSRAYVAAATERARAHLEPRVRAAVLVEDDLLAHDHQYLVDEAIALGLGPTGAQALVGEIAAACGAGVPAPTSPAPSPRAPISPTSPTPSPRAPTSAGPAAPSRQPRGWEEPLRTARALLRAGKPVAARAACRQATAACQQTMAGDDPGPVRQIRTLTDEVESVLAKAQEQWRRARDDVRRDRPAAAVAVLEELARTAADIDTLVPAGPRLQTLLRDARAAAAAAAVSVEPPSQVRVVPLADGTVRIAWRASTTPGVVYRVLRLAADGSTQTVGRTGATELDDGGAAPGSPPHGYGVVAVLAGAQSQLASADLPSRPAPTPPPPPERPLAQPAAPRPRAAGPVLPDIAVSGVVDGRLRFDWPPGVTEVMVVFRQDAPPVDPADPLAQQVKVTNMRYEIDSGYVLPAGTRHVAVASCRRDERGTLHTAPGFGPGARMTVDVPG